MNGSTELIAPKGADPMAEWQATSAALVDGLTALLGQALADGIAIADCSIGGLAPRDLLIIFRPPVRRTSVPGRANVRQRVTGDSAPGTGVTPAERRKPGDLPGHLTGLLRALLASLPDQQLAAVLALIDGQEARTYEQAAQEAHLALGTLKQHLQRFRRRWPGLHAQVMAFRRVQLQDRHAGAAERAKEHTRRWFAKQRAWDTQYAAALDKVRAVGLEPFQDRQGLGYAVRKTGKAAPGRDIRRLVPAEVRAVVERRPAP